MRASLTGDSDADRRGAWRCARRWPSAASTGQHAPGSARRLPPRRDQAALRRLGRADGLLPLFGDAGRPLRARRAWRGPRDLAGLDALCAALQMINHLQDCGKDYRELDRVYLPQDALAAAGVERARRWPRARPARRCAGDRRPGARTAGLLDGSRPFAGQIRDRRLAWRSALIQRLAEDLTATADARAIRCQRACPSPPSSEVAGLAIGAPACDRRRAARRHASRPAARRP